MTRFARHIRPSVQAELDAARRLEAAGDATGAFRRLQRAHVLGQAATREHVRVHWQMLRWALRRRDAVEAFGQAWRLVAAAVLTWAGWVPQGNTGGADVSGMRRMPVPPELQRLIELARAGTASTDTIGTHARCQDAGLASAAAAQAAPRRPLQP